MRVPGRQALAIHPAGTDHPRIAGTGPETAPTKGNPMATRKKLTKKALSNVKGGAAKAAPVAAVAKASAGRVAAPVKGIKLSAKR